MKMAENKELSIKAQKKLQSITCYQQKKEKLESSTCYQEKKLELELGQPLTIR